MSFTNLLARPFPLIGGTQKKFAAALAFGVFVFLFLYTFKPFGFGVFASRQILLYTLGFGGITFSIMFINLLVLDKIFPSFFKEETWTVGREIFITLVYIALIGLGNYFFATLVSIIKPTLNRLLYSGFVSLSLAIIPVVVWTLIKENMLLKRNREEAEKFNPILYKEVTTGKEIAPIKPDDGTQLPIVFTSERETTTLEAVPENVYFISSADNYIKVYLTEGNSIVTKLRRGSLKRTEEDLKNHPQFYRCHRTYIVNLQKVKLVTGNARGLKLNLENCQEEVPVSRSLNDTIREKLEEIHSR
jgi:hypothetical protein